MPRKTEIIQAEENPVSSPLRRSSRIIQKETKTEAVVVKDDPIPSRLRNRRASIETASPVPEKLQTSTPRKRRSSVTVESKAPLSPEEPSVEQEKKQTRSRRKSVEPVEAKSKPATRSRRPSIEDEIKEEPKTPKRSRRRTSIGENVKVMEVIEEISKTEMKLDVIKEGGEEDDAANDFVDEEISKLGVVKLSPGRASPLIKRTSPGSRIYLQQSNLTDTPTASESKAEKRISDVFLPKNARCSFSEPMEVDSTLLYADQTFSTPQLTEEAGKLEKSTENASVIVIEDDVSICNNTFKEPSQAPEDLSCFIVENDSEIYINKDAIDITKGEVEKTIESDEKLEMAVESVEEKETIESEIETSSAKETVTEEPVVEVEKSFVHQAIEIKKSSPKKDKNESYNQVETETALAKTFETTIEVSFTKEAVDESSDEKAKSDQEGNKSINQIESSSRIENVPAETVDEVEDFEKKMNETKSLDDIQKETVESIEEPKHALSAENMDESVNEVGNSPGKDKIEEPILEETIEPKHEVQSHTMESSKKVDSCINLVDDEDSELDIDEDAIKMAEKECEEELKKTVEQNEATVGEVSEAESLKKLEESRQKEVIKSTDRVDQEATEAKKFNKEGIDSIAKVEVLFKGNKSIDNLESLSRIENIPTEIVESVSEVVDFEKKIIEAEPMDDIRKETRESIEEAEQSLSVENANEVGNSLTESLNENGKSEEEKIEIETNNDANSLENTLEDKLLDNTYSNNQTLPLDEPISKVEENETNRNEKEKKTEESMVECPEKTEMELMEVSYAEETEASLNSSKLENKASQENKKPIKMSDLELATHSINKPSTLDDSFEMSKKSEMSQDYEFNLPSDDDTSMLEKSTINKNNLTEIAVETEDDVFEEDKMEIANGKFVEEKPELNQDDISVKESSVSDVLSEKVNGIENEPQKKRSFEEMSSTLNDDTFQAAKVGIENKENHTLDISKNNESVINGETFNSPKKKIKTSEFDSDLSSNQCDEPNKVKDSLDSSWLVQLRPAESSKSDLELSINSANKSSTSSPKKKIKKSKFEPDLSNIKCETPNKVKDSLDSSWLVLPGAVKPSTTNID